MNVWKCTSLSSSGIKNEFIKKKYIKNNCIVWMVIQELCKILKKNIFKFKFGFTDILVMTVISPP